MGYNHIGRCLSDVISSNTHCSGPDQSWTTSNWRRAGRIHSWLTSTRNALVTDVDCHGVFLPLTCEVAYDDSSGRQTGFLDGSLNVGWFAIIFVQTYSSSWAVIDLLKEFVHSWFATVQRLTVLVIRSDQTCGLWNGWIELSWTSIRLACFDWVHTGQQ